VVLQNLRQGMTSIMLTGGTVKINRQSAHDLKQQAHFSVCLALHAPELVDASHFHHTPETVPTEAPKPLKGSPGLGGPPDSLNTRLTQERACQLPRQATTFVCPLCSHNRPTERTHPGRPQQSSEEGGGSLERSSIPSLCELHKSSSESV